MGILKATLWTLGTMLAVGALVDRASRGHHHRFVQTTLDQPRRGAAAWQ